LRKEAYEPFVRTLQSFKKHTDHGVWDDLGSSMREARKTALDLFSQSASRYNTDVYTKKKAELSLKLDHALLGLFEAQIRALLEEYKADFGENLKAKLDEPNSNYNTVSAELKNTTMDNFVRRATGTMQTDFWRTEVDFMCIRCNDRGCQLVN